MNMFKTNATMENGSDPAQPLKGLKVVEICHSVAGPFGGAILAELGAEVIKIENPKSGDHARGWGPPYWCGSSSVFQCLNRDKRGITLDLSNDDDLARLRKMIIKDVDIVLQNIRPGALAKLGLSAEALLKEKPSLIYCNLGAFGAVGPLREHPGYDPLMQAFGGLMSVTGEADGGPVRVGPAVIDMGSGMWATIGILAAVARRYRTGLGCIVDTSLFETAVAWMTVQIAGYLAAGQLRQPMGSGIAEIVPHQAFRARDRYIMVAAGNDGLFQKLCAALNQPEWAKDKRFLTNDGRVRNRDILIPAMSDVFKTKDAAEWARLLEQHGVPNAPIQNVVDVVNHEQTKALGIIQRAPDSEMSLIGLPLSFNGQRPPYKNSAPSIGQHNADVLNKVEISKGVVRTTEA